MKRYTCEHCKAVYVSTTEGTACRYCNQDGVVEAPVGQGEDTVLQTVQQVLQGRVDDACPETLPDPLVDWRAWLRALHEAMYVKRMDPRTRRPWYDERRRMTAEEWVQLQHLIREHELICSMRNANMGFGCGMTIFEPGEAIYPGVPIKPVVLCDVTKAHLPLAAGQDRTTFDEGWEAFSPFTHSEANVERLKANGLQEPRDKGYYDY